MRRERRHVDDVQPPLPARITLRRFRLSLLGGPLAARSCSLPPRPRAQDAPSNCPPGSWFCADAQEKPRAGAPGSEARSQAARPLRRRRAMARSSLSLRQRRRRPRPGSAAASGDLSPAAASAAGRDLPAAADAAASAVLLLLLSPAPAEAARRSRSEWGLNLRAEGAIQGNGSAFDPADGGGRHRPSLPPRARRSPSRRPSISSAAATTTTTVRNETEFTVNALVFVNPRSRVQLYFLAGLGGSWANVTRTARAGYPNGSRTSYTYFGGQAGAGLEFRIAKHFAMNLDARAFIRSRTDSDGGELARVRELPARGRRRTRRTAASSPAGMTFYF